MVNITSIDALKRAREEKTVKKELAYEVAGEMLTTNMTIDKGRGEIIELTKPIGEMVTSEQGRKELIEKVVLDTELGREEVPLLYKPIYDTISDPNLPQILDMKWAQRGTVVFTEHFEGEEVKFGSLEAEHGPVARLSAYTAGFEYTKEMRIYNQTWGFETMNKAFGEAYNALLNHIHFAPIIGFDYKKENVTQPVYVKPDGTPGTKSEAHAILSLRATIRQAQKDTAKDKRKGSVLLVNSSHEQDLLDALGRMEMQGTNFEATTGITDIIFYDGWETTVSRKTTAYEGVEDNVAYLIRPKAGFKELVKQELQVRAYEGDPSRLIEQQVIADTFRGIYAAIEENVQQIKLPTL